MKFFKITGIALALLWLGSPLLTTVAEGKDNTSYPYTQTYTILIDNETAGTETVLEKKDSSGLVVATSEHNLLISDGMALNRMEFSTRMVFPKGSHNPESYYCQYRRGQSGDSYDIAIKNGKITRVLTRDGMASEVTMPFTSNMVIVDPYVYHLYDYLIRRYDRKKKGVQEFADFIPIIGNDIVLKVTFLGEEKLNFAATSIEVSNFQVDFVGVQSVTLAVDKNNRLVRLANPAQSLRVIRQDLLP